jgi:hypothetical protein
VQEKRQERVDVVHIPKDVITVLGKRWGEDLEKLLGYLKGGKPVDSESSNSPLLSSSAASGPDDGSTNVVQPPAPNPAASTADPDPLREPTRCSWVRGSCLGVPWRDLLWLDDDSDELHRHLYDETSPGHNSDDELAWWVKPVQHGIQTVQDWTQTAHRWAQTAQQRLKSNFDMSLEAFIDTPKDSDFDWDGWMHAVMTGEDSIPGPASPEKFGQAYKYRLDPANLPSTSGYAPSPPLAEHEHEVVTPSPSPLLSSLGSPKEPEDPVVPGPPQSPVPELPLDHQSSNADSQPVDLQAAIYAAKGKAKESRHISGTARDVGKAAQRDLHTAERSPEVGSIVSLGLVLHSSAVLPTLPSNKHSNFMIFLSLTVRNIGNL